MFILHRIVAFAPAPKPYRIGLLFTYKNGDFGAISVKERSCAVRTGFLKWRVTYRIGVHTMLDSFSYRHSNLSGVMWKWPEKLTLDLDASTLPSYWISFNNKMNDRSNFAKTLNCYWSLLMNSVCNKFTVSLNLNPGSILNYLKNIL